MNNLIKVYDAKIDNIGKELLILELEKIKHQTFDLKQNYLSIDLNEFLSFDIMTYKDDVVAFSGIQIRPNIFPSNTARVYSRFYISEKFRRKNLSTFKDRLNNYEIPELAFPGFLVLLPKQIKKAKEVGLSAIFISREKINEFSGRSERLRLNTFKSLHNGKYELKILPRLYNVCGNIDSKPCWQYIFYMMLSPLKETIFDEMKSITIDEWKSKYGK